MIQPVFPVTVHLQDGPTWVLNTVDELGWNLEWFDSDDDDGTVSIVDAENRPVRIKVEALEVTHLEVEQMMTIRPRPAPQQKRATG